jgi:hypothetical protein
LHDNDVVGVVVVDDDDDDDDDDAVIVGSGRGERGEMLVMAAV